MHLMVLDPGGHCKHTCFAEKLAVSDPLSRFWTWLPLPPDHFLYTVECTAPVGKSEQTREFHLQPFNNIKQLVRSFWGYVTYPHLVWKNHLPDQIFHSPEMKDTSMMKYGMQNWKWKSLTSGTLLFLVVDVTLIAVVNCWIVCNVVFICCSSIGKLRFHLVVLFICKEVKN